MPSLLSARPSLRLLLTSSLLLAACGGPPRSAAEAQIDGLPAYDAEAQARFDDSIDPVMVGLSLDKPIYRGDLRLRDRSQAADFIVRAKLTTVTEERSEVSRSFVLLFKPTERVGGKESAPDPVEVHVHDRTPSFGMIVNVKDKLRGRTAIVLGKRFKADGAARLHVVVLPDDPEVLEAVRENIALEELKK